MSNTWIGLFADQPTAELVHELAKLRTVDYSDSNEGSVVIQDMIEAIEIELSSR
jgi:hypothetical protein